MGIEIERKYLIDYRLLPVGRLTSPKKIVQGYLTPHDGTTVRVRISDEEGYLTVKGPGLQVRQEFEYPIPVQDAKDMLSSLSISQVSKTRWLYQVGTHTWEIDQFSGHLAGFWMAEVELSDANEQLNIPDWVLKEVTSDRRFTNVWLAKHGIPLCAAV